MRLNTTTRLSNNIQADKNRLQSVHLDNRGLK